MSASAINAIPAPGAAPAWVRGLESPLGMPSGNNIPDTPSAADVRKAAGQFEAILLRQLLSPTIEPMMSGGLGGGSAAGGGGGVYGYILTDTLCNSLARGGGLGLAAMFERQLAPESTMPVPGAQP